MIRQTHFYVCFLVVALGIGVTDQQSHRSHQLPPQIFQSSNTDEYANFDTHDRNKQYIYLEDQIVQQTSAIKDIVVEISLFTSNYIGSFSSPHYISSMHSGDSIYSYSDTNMIIYSPTSIPSRRQRATPQPVINSIPSQNTTIAPSKHHNALNVTDHTAAPSSFPSTVPTDQPTSLPCVIASVLHSRSPTNCVTVSPSSVLSRTPSPPSNSAPTRRTSQAPTLSSIPSTEPTSSPAPSPLPLPTEHPSHAPTAPQLSVAPTDHPSTSPTPHPTNAPSTVPTASHTAEPSVPPTGAPTTAPVCTPTAEPSVPPTGAPTTAPICTPTSEPSVPPTGAPTTAPTCTPIAEPSVPPTGAPATAPTCTPTAEPSVQPTGAPTTAPTCTPTAEPSVPPTGAPTTAPTCTPTSDMPTAEPTTVLNNTTSQSPNNAPVSMPSAVPSMQPSANSSAPTVSPITKPSAAPIQLLSLSPSHIPSIAPTNIPSPIPSAVPSVTLPAPVVFVFLAANASLPDSEQGKLMGNESRAIQAAAIREVRNFTGSRAKSIIANVTIAVLEEAVAQRMNSPLQPHYTQLEVVWEVSITLVDRNVSAEALAAAVEGLHSALVSGELQRAIREISRVSPEVPSLWYLVACEADGPDSAAKCLQQIYPPPAADNSAQVCAQGTPEWGRLYDYPAPLPWYWYWILLLLSAWAALSAVCAYWIVQSALSPERRQTCTMWVSVLPLVCSTIQLAYFAVVLMSYYDSTFGEGKLACLEFVFLFTSSTASSSETREGLLVMLRALTYAFTLSVGSAWLWVVYSSAMPLLPRSQSVGVRGRSFRMAQSACLVLTGTGGVCAVFVLVSWAMGMEVGHLNQRALIVEGLAGAALLLQGCVLALLVHCELHTSSSSQNVLRVVTLPKVLCVLYGSLVLVCTVRSVLRSPAAALAVHSISSRLLGLALVIAAAAASAREGASTMTNREVADETDAAELEWGRDARTLAPGEASVVAESDTQSEINRAAQRATAPPLQDSQQQQRSRRHNASEYVLYFEDRAFTIRMRSREEEQQDESPVLGEADESI